MTDFHAFTNDSQVATIGDLSVENGVQEIAIHGDVTITRDKVGLNAAVALRDIAQRIVDALSAMALPDEAPEVPVENGSVKNPFE